MVDKIKLVLAVLLVFAGIWGFYHLAEQAMILRVLSVFAGVVLAIVVSLTTEQGQRFFSFSKDSWAEAKKVVWPSRRETTQTTMAVFGFVVVMAVFLYLTDKTLEWVLFELILGWEKL